MTDLKLIDELLLDVMRSNKREPHEMFNHSHVAQEALVRIRKAWVAGEMPEISATWGTYFEEN